MSTVAIKLKVCEAHLINKKKIKKRKANTALDKFYRICGGSITKSSFDKESDSGWSKMSETEIGSFDAAAASSFSSVTSWTISSINRKTSESASQSKSLSKEKLAF